MSLLPIIRTRLISAGVIDTGWDCFIGYIPDVQDQLIGLSPTGGFPQDTQENDNLIETFQANVRSGVRAYAVCEAKWAELFSALQDANLSSSGVRLIQALQTGPLIWYDDRNRPNMSVNFRVVRDRP